MKTKARRSYYGGSKEELDAQRGSYATGVDQGNAGYGQAQTGLAEGGATGSDIAQRGTKILDSALTGQPSQAGAAALNSLDPQAVAKIRAQQAMDANSAANLAAGASGGALGLRQALQANAAAGAGVAQGAAAAGVEGEQAKAQLIAQNAVQRAQLDQTRQNTLLDAGGQLALSGNGQTIQAAGTGGQLGLTSQGQYLNQLQNTDLAQLKADTDYDTRRQQDQQRKAQNLWGMAGTLTGGAMKALGGAG